MRGCSSWRTADGRARGRSSGAGAWVAGGRPERPHGRRRRQTGRALAAAAREGAERARRRAGRLRSARRERRAAGAGETGAGPAICPVDPRGRRDPGPRGPREAARCLCRGLGRGHRVGFAGAQSRATGAVRGTLLLERTWAPSVSPVLTCVLTGEEVRGAWKMWALRALGDRSCLLKFQETKQTSFSPFLPHGRIDIICIIH